MRCFHEIFAKKVRRESKFSFFSHCDVRVNLITMQLFFRKNSVKSTFSLIMNRRNIGKLIARKFASVLYHSVEMSRILLHEIYGIFREINA